MATYGPGIDQSQHAKSAGQPYNKTSYYLRLLGPYGKQWILVFILPCFQSWPAGFALR